MKSEKVTIFGIDFIKETDDEGNVFMYKENPIDNPKLKEEDNSENKSEKSLP